jgi:hypothetical protein
MYTIPNINETQGNNIKHDSLAGEDILVKALLNLRA